MRKPFNQEFLAFFIATSLVIFAGYIVSESNSNTQKVEASISYAQEIGELKAEIAHLKKEIARLETADKILANVIQFATHPATIDANQRTWFEQELKNDPDQVRGVDSLYPRERK